jgi:hypothetical protein
MQIDLHVRSVSVAFFLCFHMREAAACFFQVLQSELLQTGQKTNEPVIDPTASVGRCPSPRKTGHCLIYDCFVDTKQVRVFAKRR